jgi:hypothetical protein
LDREEVLIDACAQARGLLADDYFENWEEAHDVLHEALCQLKRPETYVKEKTT